VSAPYLTPYVFDGGDSFCYANRNSWDEAQELADTEGWELLGERQKLRFDLQTHTWKTKGDTLQ
jgi:hypothetical protein